MLKQAQLLQLRQQDWPAALPRGSGHQHCAEWTVYLGLGALLQQVGVVIGEHSDHACALTLATAAGLAGKLAEKLPLQLLVCVSCQHAWQRSLAQVCGWQHERWLKKSTGAVEQKKRGDDGGAGPEREAWGSLSAASALQSTL